MIPNKLTTRFAVNAPDEALRLLFAAVCSIILTSLFRLHNEIKYQKGLPIEHEIRSMYNCRKAVNTYRLLFDSEYYSLSHLLYSLDFKYTATTN